MSFNIGLNVIETEGTATPAISGAPTSITGFVLRSRRGPTSVPVRVSDFIQFAARFGGFDQRFDGAYCVDGFFKNGGREAWITRVLGAKSAAASVTLQDRTGTDTLTVAAGYRGKPDHGSWGNGLHVTVRDNPTFSTRLTADLSGNQPARLQGTAFTGGLADLSPVGTTSRSVQINLDGGASSFKVTFDTTNIPVPTKATPVDVADAINVIAGARLVASAVRGGVLLVSRNKGAGSEVTIVDDANSTASLLGFGAGNASATGAAAAGTYTEAQVGSISGFAVGDIVRLDDGISSNWRVLTGVEVRDDGAGSEKYFILWTSPPAAERNEYRVSDAAAAATCEFDLIVSEEQPAELGPVAVETWEKVTMNPAAPRYAPLLVNNALSGSAYVTLADAKKKAYSGADAPRAGIAIRLGIATPNTTRLTRTKGKDGDEPTTADYRSRFALYDTVEIQLLSVPETMPDGMLSAVTRAGLDYASGPSKGDCIYVGFTPVKKNVAGARAFGQTFRAAKVFGAIYWPWITVVDPVGAGANPVRTIPPVGHILGVYARIDQTRGVWKAPAGNQATLRGVLSATAAISDIDHTDLVKNGSVNAIRAITGSGIVIDSSRTLSTDTRWLYVNVRLLFNFVKASLREGLRWVKQEPNREVLWNKIKYNAVTPFLLRLFQQGAFGPGTPEQVFTVICDASNNPPDQIMLGNLQVEIYFYPGRPAETIIIKVGQQEGASAAGEG